MKTLFFFVCFFWCFQGLTQKPLDTLFANSDKTVSLFFPKPIRQGIVGKDHFVFSYDTENQNYLGLLQASPGVESNLLAITSDGQVYSYILRYAKKLPQLNYFISTTESIGNEIPKAKAETVLKPKAKAVDTKFGSAISTKDCEAFLKNSRHPLRKSEKQYGIKLSVRDIKYYKGALYYLMEIQNKTGIDYQPNYLRFFTENKTGLSRKSIQKLQIQPKYVYQMPKVIPSNATKEFVVVLPKFTIDKHKIILIELNELYGERNLELEM
jgi:hypothetical protein